MVPAYILLIYVGFQEEIILPMVFCRVIPTCLSFLNKEEVIYIIANTHCSPTDIMAVYICTYILYTYQRYSDAWEPERATFNVAIVC